MQCRICDGKLGPKNTVGICIKTRECKLANTREQSRLYYQTHTEEVTERIRQWNEDNPDNAIERGQRWRESHRDQERARDIMRRHGMTVEEYDEYLSHGCGVSICGNDAEVIDHDHNIGCPDSFHSCDKCRRGPLCRSHNAMSDEKLKELGYI